MFKTKREFKAAYRKRAAEAHPDKVSQKFAPGTPEFKKATMHSARVNANYNNIKSSSWFEKLAYLLGDDLLFRALNF